MKSLSLTLSKRLGIEQSQALAIFPKKKKKKRKGIELK